MDTDVAAKLDFHHFQFSVGHDGVAAAGGHLHHVPCLHGGLYAVDDGIAAASSTSTPYVIAEDIAFLWFMSVLLS